MLSVEPYFLPLLFFFLLVFKDPFGSNNMSSYGFTHQIPNIIFGVLIEFLLHSLNPLSVQMCIINRCKLYQGHQTYKHIFRRFEWGFRSDWSSLVFKNQFFRVLGSLLQLLYIHNLINGLCDCEKFQAFCVTYLHVIVAFLNVRQNTRVHLFNIDKVSYLFGVYSESFPLLQTRIIGLFIKEIKFSIIQESIGTLVSMHIKT